MTRRDFLRVSALGAAGVLAASCAPQVVEKTVEVMKEVEVEKTVEVEVEKEVPVEVTKEVVKEVVKEVEVTPERAKVTVTWASGWSAWNGEEFEETEDEMEQDFIAEHPEMDLTVDRAELTGDMTATLMTSARAGDMLDVYMCQAWYVPWMVELVPSAMVDDIQAQLGGPDAFTFLAPWKGHEYMFYIYGGPHQPYWNQDWLDEAGVEAPMTWDDWIPTCQLLTDAANEKYAHGHMMGNPYHFAHNEFFCWLLTHEGAALIDDQNMPVFNNDAGVETLEFIKEQEDAGICLPGGIGHSSTEIRQAFAAETIAEENFSGVWEPQILEALGVEFNWVQTLAPTGPGGAQGSFSNGTGVALNQNAKNMEWSAEWLVYLTCGEGNFKWHAVTHQLPVYKPIMDRRVAEEPRLEIHAAQARIPPSVGQPVMEEYDTLMQALSTHGGAWWLGEKSARQALDDMVNEYIEALQRL